MSEPPASHPFSEPAEGDDMQIAELIRLAGHRPQPAAWRAARVRTAVEAEWRGAVRRRDRRTLLQWVALAVAASTVLVLTGKWMMPAPAASHAANAIVIVAHLARATGLVTIAENRTDAWRLLAPGSSVSSGAAIRTDAQSRAALTLAHGQSLRLDMDTQIVVETESRIRLDRGSVYLDSGVHLDSGRPGAAPLATAGEAVTASGPDLAGAAARAGRREIAGVEVVTPFGTLRDVGTQFEASLIGSGLRVRVREGEVALMHRDVRVAATRGESVSVARDGTVTRGSTPIAGPEWAWTSAAAPTFQLDEAPLVDFLNWVAREEGWDWRFADTAVQQRAAGVVLHGSIDKLTPAEALDAVLPTCGMGWHLDAGSLMITLATGDK
jgi:ferric-dicitrate binding protein FerR (iron transport regulator)